MSPAAFMPAIRRSWRKFSSAAKARGIAIGAHPGFPDLWGFGRRTLPFTAAEIERLVAYQIGAAQALCTYAGARLGYVKAHGALSNIAMEIETIAQAIARAVKVVGLDLCCSCPRRNEIGDGGPCTRTCRRPRNLCRPRLYGRWPRLSKGRAPAPCCTTRKKPPRASSRWFRKAPS